MSVSFIEKFVFSWEIVVGSFLKVSQLSLKRKAECSNAKFSCLVVKMWKKIVFVLKKRKGFLKIS